MMIGVALGVLISLGKSNEYVIFLGGLASRMMVSIYFFRGCRSGRVMG